MSSNTTYICPQCLYNNNDTVTKILSVLLFVSELLPFLDSIKSNGILDAMCKMFHKKKGNESETQLNRKDEIYYGSM